MIDSSMAVYLDRRMAIYGIYFSPYSLHLDWTPLDFYYVFHTPLLASFSVALNDFTFSVDVSRAPRLPSKVDSCRVPCCSYSLFSGAYWL